MIETTFTCDAPNCKRTKGEGNRWLMYRVNHLPGVFVVTEWNAADSASKDWGHLCSDQCAIVMMVKTVRRPQLSTAQMIVEDEAKEQLAFTEEEATDMADHVRGD